jgi:hypothetical protein
MKLFTFCFYLLSGLLVFSLFGCGGQSAKSQDLEILAEFSKLHPSTQEFFDRDAKLQCACLKENKTTLEKLLENTQSFADSIREGQLSVDSARVAMKIETEIYTVWADYNQCIADSPPPTQETMEQVAADMRSFTGGSEPGGESYNKMVLFNNALMRKHCEELQALGVKVNELSQLVAPGIQ